MRATASFKGEPRMTKSQLPVVVIGAGPVGMAAAVHLSSRGESPLVIEQGASVGAGVGSWGHVRLFTPWRYAVDAKAVERLAASGWTMPEPEAHPTGNELVKAYLEPLAQLPELTGSIRLNSRVVSVARDGFDKMKSVGRDEAPYAVVVEANGAHDVVLAKAVIDASGTMSTPNPLGASGVPAIGEDIVRDRIFAGIPDVLGVDRARYAGKRVLVVGSGHSAFNVLLDLVDLSESAPGTSIIWAVRKAGLRLGQLFGGGINDALPARGELGERVKALVEQNRLRLVTGFKISRLTESNNGILVAGLDEVLPPVDEIVAATGFRPDLSILSEVRLDLDSAVESPSALAPLIDPNLHSCGSVPPHGAEELRHPDANFYIAGMKSYGRAPTFLMLTGYEQVRSIAAAIAGDWDAARDVQLVLPETGVCTTSILEERGIACCAPAATAENNCCSEAVASESGGCCSTAAPQVIQLTGAIKGGCCSE